MHASPAVLRVIEYGYVLPFMSKPSQYGGKNQASPLQNAGFVSVSIAELVHIGCEKEVVGIPFICSPLSVAENGVGKKRLAINFKHMNMFIYSCIS